MPFDEDFEKETPRGEPEKILLGVNDEADFVNVKDKEGQESIRDSRKRDANYRQGLLLRQSYLDKG